jgi:sigma-B regulation protein RsbU (phosphoserine phosphatase)
MKIRIGRIEQAFAVLLVLYFILTFVVPPGNFWLALLKYSLVLLGALVAVRISHYAVRKSLWRLRNRLIVAYFFIAVVPIVLITTLLGLGAYLVAGQLSTYLVTSELERCVNSLHSTAEFLIRGDLERDQWVNGVGPFLQARYPGLEITVDGSRPWQFPAKAAIHPPPAGWPEHSGLVIRDGLLYGWTRRLREGRNITITFPVTREFLGELTPGLGETNIGSALSTQRGSLLHPSPTRITSRNRTPPAVNWMDIAIFSMVPIPVAEWSSPGKIQEDVLAVWTRPSAILRQVFSQKITFAEDIIPFLFYGSAILFLIAELMALKVGVSITQAITGAVHDLYEGTQRVTKGDFSHRIPTPGADQLGALAVSFNQMTENLQRLVEVEKERERLTSELAIAREVQNQLYPKHVPRMKSLCLTAHCDPAWLVSGDYYDYQQLHDTKIAIAMGDVCGKGISAALLMATIQSSFRMQLRMSPDSPTSTLVSQMNKQLHAHTAPEKFSTFFFGIYDEPTSTLTYTNAGHLPPILIHRGTAARLDVNGLVVGAFDFAAYEESRVTLDPGDLLVFFTDGITEPENEYGEMFGEDRLTELALKNAQLDDDKLAQMIIDAAKSWTTGAELQDDMTLLLMRRR